MVASSSPGILGALADPRYFTDIINTAGRDLALLKSQLRMMLLIRRAEEKIGDAISDGTVVCPCHLGIGQEAIAVGVSEHVRSSDRVFGTHRSHSHYLAMGGSLYGLMAEVLGKVQGCSRGMGGSMHLYGANHGFVGSVPIVAGTVSLAVGAALAARKDGRGNVAVAYFGDGATEEGAVHESMNLAAVWKLPVLFVCENNLFSSHLHISLRQPSDRIGRYAEAHCIPVETVDGNDVVSVSAAASRLVATMRAGEGPTFLEAITYRWRGHVGPREDNDVGVNRSSDLTLWKNRDPVRRLFEALKHDGSMNDQEFRKMTEEVISEVDAAWAAADKADYPPQEALLAPVFSRGVPA